jgi:hypothetical protein
MQIFDGKSNGFIDDTREFWIKQNIFTGKPGCRICFVDITVRPKDLTSDLKMDHLMDILITNVCPKCNYASDIRLDANNDFVDIHSALHEDIQNWDETIIDNQEEGEEVRHVYNVSFNL